MRTALVSLIALSVAATAAMAQDAASPAAPETPASPPAPVEAPTAAEAAPAASTPDAGASAAAPDATATPAAPAEPAPPAPPPELPTTGDGAEVISFLEKVCVPAVAGQGKIEALAKSFGMKSDRRSGGFVKRLGTAHRDYTITLVPSSANPNVCWAQVRYAVDQSLPIVSALNIWSFLHEPELMPQRRDFSVDATNKRVTSSWEHYTDKESIGLVFVELRNPDGTPMNKNYDTATLQYSVRTF